MFTTEQLIFKRYKLFMRKVNVQPGDQCWNWTAYVREGYGLSWDV